MRLPSGARGFESLRLRQLPPVRRKHFFIKKALSLIGTELSFHGCDLFSLRVFPFHRSGSHHRFLAEFYEFLLGHGTCIIESLDVFASHFAEPLGLFLVLHAFDYDLGSEALEQAYGLTYYLIASGITQGVKQSLPVTLQGFST